MLRNILAIVAVMGAGILLGWMFEPALTVLAGGLLWLYILYIAGGAEDGNPARTAIKLCRVPDRPMAYLALKKVRVQKNPVPKRALIWMLIISGAALIAIGIAWMHALGQI